MEDFDSCPTSADIIIAISNILRQFVHKRELKSHLTNYNYYACSLNPCYFQLGKTPNVTTYFPGKNLHFLWTKESQ